LIGYYTSKITDNIGRTPENFLVCRDAVIGRTGFQTYKGEELLREHGKDKLKDLGFDNVSSADDIPLFRDPSEVFHSDTLRSFEGKPFTDNHPPGFVTTENIGLYQKGHIQNIRKGSEPLDSGDWPMLADIVITDAALAAEIENGDRPDLSSGYGYSLKAHNGTLWQTDIVGNHVARVPKGRAGSDARIYDAAPADADVKPQPQTSPCKEAYRMPKEKGKIKNFLTGLGLMTMAKDAATKPEDMAEALAEMQAMPPEGEQEDEARGNNNRRSARAADADEPDDHGKRMHAALDRVLAHHADSEHAKDADLESLKGLMGKYFSEEQGEPQHAEDSCEQGDVTDPGTMGPTIADAADDDPGKEDEEEDKREGHADDAKAADAVPLFATAEKRPAFGADAVGGAAFVLKAMKPHIAKACQLARAGRGQDAARHLTRAFDTVATSVNATAKRTGTGDGYKAFAGAANDRSDEARRSQSARARDAEANDADTPGSNSAARIEKLNAMTKARFRVNLAEVK
jgi:hypothetical protein